MGITVTLPAPQSDLANYLLEDPCIFDLAEAKERADEKDIRRTTSAPWGLLMRNTRRLGGGQWTCSGIGFVDAALGMSVLLLRFYEVVTVGGYLPEMLFTIGK